MQHGPLNLDDAYTAAAILREIIACHEAAADKLATESRFAGWTAAELEALCRRYHVEV
jgi:hypothetical protein